jgi:hypothetical protein
MKMKKELFLDVVLQVSKKTLLKNGLNIIKLINTPIVKIKMLFGIKKFIFIK